MAAWRTSLGARRAACRAARRARWRRCAGSVGTGLAAALLGVLDDPRAVLTASCACPLAVVALTVLAAVAPLARIWLFVGRVDAAASDPLGTLVLLSARNFAEDAVWSAALVPGLALAAQSAAKGWEAFSFAAVATATAWATTAQGYASASIARGIGVEAGPGGTWDSAGTGALAALIALCSRLGAVVGGRGCVA